MARQIVKKDNRTMTVLEDKRPDADHSFTQAKEMVDYYKGLEQAAKDDRVYWEELVAFGEAESLEETLPQQVLPNDPSE